MTKTTRKILGEPLYTQLQILNKQIDADIKILCNRKRVKFSSLSELDLSILRFAILTGWYANRKRKRKV